MEPQEGLPLAAAGLQSTWGGGAWAGSRLPLSEALLLRPALRGFFSGLCYQLDATGTRARAFPLSSQVAYFLPLQTTLPPFVRPFRPGTSPSSELWASPAPTIFSETLVLRNLLLRPLKELLATCVTESKLTLLTTLWANESEKRGAEARKRL